MKRLFYFALTMFCLQSCAPTVYTFRQVGTLTSDNVKFCDKGYEYTHSDFTIAYNFWSEGGEMAFTITNKSDKDIYLLMDKCHFVINGTAKDYYKGRTYVDSYASSSSVATTAGVGASANAQLSGQLNSLSTSMINAPGSNVAYSGAVTTGYGASKMVAGTMSRSSQSAYAVETPEPKVVCIPARSSKHFSEFHVMGVSYRACGFVRDPGFSTNLDEQQKEKEGVNWDFVSASESPRAFENRLVFNIDGKEVPVVNTFYISQLTNIYELWCYVTDFSKDCNGRNKTWYKDLKIDKTYAPNKFYTIYKCAIRSAENDRIDKK